MTIYAIGDIHGRFDLLTRALAAIPAEAQIICLGDYVDRGPQSREVIELLMSRPEIICIKGNHEDMMVQAWDRRTDPHDFWDYHWIANGGGETIASYPDGQPDPAHIEWLRNLPLYHQTADHLFVHAGLWPHGPIEKQDPECLMWIRDRFLDVPNPYPLHVVHGHTPRHKGKPVTDEPELLPWRTNLDTGAFHTGILTIGKFVEGRRECQGIFRIGDY